MGWWEGGGGGGVTPLEFCGVTIFLKYFTSNSGEIECDVLYKIKSILWVIALLGIRDIIQSGGQDGGHLGFFAYYSNLSKNAEIENVFCESCKTFHIIKQFAAFGSVLNVFHRKKMTDAFLFKNGLTSCYL